MPFVDRRDGANHLEHFHVYNKEPEVGSFELVGNTPDTLQWHTDAGLFLAFVPGVTCGKDGDTPDTSFWVMDPATRRPARAVFPRGSIAIMMGVGAEHWMDTPGLALKATKHAVKMKHGITRAWYGMSKCSMFLKTTM